MKIFAACRDIIVSPAYFYLVYFRCVYFDPDGSCLYSGVKDFLKVYGWEPAQCFDSVPITWGEVVDMSTTAQNQLVSEPFF